MSAVSCKYTGGTEQFYDNQQLVHCESFEEFLGSHSPGSDNSYLSLNSGLAATSGNLDQFNINTTCLGDEFDSFMDSSNCEFANVPPYCTESQKTLLNLDFPDSRLPDPSFPPEAPSTGSLWSDQTFFHQPLDMFPDIETSHIEPINIENSLMTSDDDSNASYLPKIEALPLKSEMMDTPKFVLPLINSNQTEEPAEKPTRGNKLRQRGGKQVMLWQFLYYALMHPKDYEHMIHWIDMSAGVFQFSSKNKDDLARAWGAVKNNRCPMTYPKLARALRKYMEGKKFVTKLRRKKLQYVFRPEFLEQLQNENGFRQLSPADIEKIYTSSRPR